MKITLAFEGRQCKIEGLLLKATIIFERKTRISQQLAKSPGVQDFVL